MLQTLHYTSNQDGGRSSVPTLCHRVEFAEITDRRINALRVMWGFCKPWFLAVALLFIYEESLMCRLVCGQPDTNNIHLKRRNLQELPLLDWPVDMSVGIFLIDEVLIKTPHPRGGLGLYKGAEPAVRSKPVNSFSLGSRLCFCWTSWHDFLWWWTLRRQSFSSKLAQVHVWSQR